MILLGAAGRSWAQTPLSLEAALARARTGNPSLQAAAARVREADAAVDEARAGRLPRVDVTEAWLGSDQPVVAFGALLSARRFASTDFAIDRLNQPGATALLRTAVTVDQPLFDATRGFQTRAAQLGRDLSDASRRLTDQELAFAVTGAYGRILAAQAAGHVARSALEATEADRARAVRRRDAGLVTDADVLQVDVQVAQARARSIAVSGEETVARATLNQLMGEPLDSAFALGQELPLRATPAPAPEALESEALSQRPELTLAALAIDLAKTGHAQARAAYLPRVSAQAGWELAGTNPWRRSSSWIVGATAQVNLFRGFADRARLAASRARETRVVQEGEATRSAVRLDLRTSLVRVRAAEARLDAGRTAVAAARESQRIVRDRYDNGLIDVVALLRAAEAVVDAETRELDARVELFVAAAALDRARGRL